MNKFEMKNGFKLRKQELSTVFVESNDTGLTNLVENRYENEKQYAGKQILLYRIYGLIKQNFSDEEILKQIQESQFTFSTNVVRITIGDEFLNSLSLLLDNKDYESALIISTTEIESIINQFYYDILSMKYDYSDSLKDEILNRLRLKDKIKWFLHITTGYMLDDKLQTNICELNSLRNNVVHYKPTKVGNYPIKDKNIVTIQKSPEIIEELQNELNDIKLFSIPELFHANELFNDNFSKMKFIFE